MMVWRGPTVPPESKRGAWLRILPAAGAGIRPGDILLTINDVQVPSAAQVARRLFRAGLWTQLRYKLTRNGEEFETRLITTPAHKPLTVENYLRVVGLLYLFIGLFIFIRRWNAPRAVHFYVFCLVSFILYSFQYSGKLDTFDLEVYWASVGARLLAPALLLHFALVFPKRSESAGKSLLKFAAVYSPPLGLLLGSHSCGRECAGLCAHDAFARMLRRIGIEFPGRLFPDRRAGVLFSYRRSPSGVLRQQMKWLTARDAGGKLAFLLLYIVPYDFDAATLPWMHIHRARAWC